MMRVPRPARALGVWLLAAFSTPPILAQTRRVSITIDDLPYVSGGSTPSSLSEEQSAATAVNRKLLAALRKHQVPPTGFVIQKRVEALGPVGPEILKSWIGSGFDLANHTYSHPDINTLPVEEIEREIMAGETVIGPLMKGVGRPLVFFRFPMNHTGDTRQRHDEVAVFLSRRGYQVATCTIDNSDFVFNAAYVRMLADKDVASARKLRAEYLAYTSAAIEYYVDLNRHVLSYAPSEVMLLHDNRLNADVMDQLLAISEKKRYRFVSLDEAQRDPAYRTPETHITKFGPMWGYRWAAERNVQVNGALEPDPPKWITDYGKGRTTK